MIWLDLSVAALLLWGAVAGYQMGLRRALGRLGALFGATLVAALGRGDLQCFGESCGALRTLEAVVCSRLVVPVSGSVEAPPELPAVLEEILQGSAIAAGGGAPGGVTAFLVQILGCTAAFLAGLLLWWGLFHLCGAAFAAAEAEGVSLSKGSRWGGALAGLLRQIWCAALALGAAVPLGWLSKVPPALLQLENTLLAIRAWHLFAALGIWY